MTARERESTKFADVFIVSNTVVLKQVDYGLQFSTTSVARITDLMGKSRKVALNAAHVASTDPRDLTGAPRDLHRLGLVNWHTANTANKVAILHQMLNGMDDDLVNMAFTEMWVVSQQTGALGSMTESPCHPSVVDWWGRTAPPRSWALQTWIEMAKCGIGTNTLLNGSNSQKVNHKSEKGGVNFELK